MGILNLLPINHQIHCCLFSLTLTLSHSLSLTGNLYCYKHCGVLQLIHVLDMGEFNPELIHDFSFLPSSAHAFLFRFFFAFYKINHTFFQLHWALVPSSCCWRLHWPCILGATDPCRPWPSQCLGRMEVCWMEE